MKSRQRALERQGRRQLERRKELEAHPEAFLPLLNLRARQAKRLIEKSQDKAYKLNGPPDELAAAASRALLGKEVI